MFSFLHHTLLRGNHLLNRAQLCGLGQHVLSRHRGYCHFSELPVTDPLSAAQLEAAQLPMGFKASVAVMVDIYIGCSMSSGIALNELY